MFELTDQQKMARQMFRAWVERHLVPRVDELETGMVPPYDLMRQMGEALGLFALARGRFEKAEAQAAAAPDQPAPDLQDEDEGGDGVDASFADLLSIEVSRHCPAYMMSFGASLGLTGGAIMRRGTWAQRRRWALPLLTMEKIGAWGMTEPDAGSDAFGGMKTTARPDGDGYILNGSKTFITNAPYADILVIYAKVDRGSDREARSAAVNDLRDRPIESFVVERGMPGVSTSKPMRKMGMHTSPTGLVYLDEVRVGRDRLLGEHEHPERTGGAGARDVFHAERTGIVPMCYGIIDRCLEVAVDYARTRQAWGRPIGEYQLIQHKLARMVVHKQNVENLLYKQWWLGRKRRRMSLAEASAGKLYCAQAATEVAMEAVQVLGGNGYMAEYHVEQLARDAKLLQIGGGTDEIQTVHVARDLLRQP